MAYGLHPSAWPLCCVLNRTKIIRSHRMQSGAIARMQFSSACWTRFGLSRRVVGGMGGFKGVDVYKARVLKKRVDTHILYCDSFYSSFHLSFNSAGSRNYDYTKDHRFFQIQNNKHLHAWNLTFGISTWQHWSNSTSLDLLPLYNLIRRTTSIKTMIFIQCHRNRCVREFSLQNNLC